MPGGPGPWRPWLAPPSEECTALAASGRPRRVRAVSYPPGRIRPGTVEGASARLRWVGMERPAGTMGIPLLLPRGAAESRGGGIAEVREHAHLAARSGG